MKTGTTIFLGIVGGLLAAVLLLWAIVPTLPVYLLIRQQLWTSMGREGYPLETAHGIGYYTLYGEPNGTRKDYSILVELYDKEDKNRCASAIISAGTLEDAVRIANSADYDRDYQPEDKDE